MCERGSPTRKETSPGYFPRKVSSRHIIGANFGHVFSCLVQFQSNFSELSANPPYRTHPTPARSTGRRLSGSRRVRACGCIILLELNKF